MQGTSTLDTLLRARNIDTLIIVGTATNVCCEVKRREMPETMLTNPSGKYVTL